MQKNNSRKSTLPSSNKTSTPSKLGKNANSIAENISVNVRIRPYDVLDKITSTNGVDLITLDPRPSGVPASPHVPGSKRHRNLCFAFDRVFDEDITQEQVYEATTKKLLPGLLQGYNATVFAYGATGCGKTHTVTGTPSDPGIISRTLQDLYKMIQNDSNVTATLSYLEVYNETIRDLLVDGSQQLNLLEDDGAQEVKVPKLSHHTPKTIEEIMSLLLKGNANRSLAPTDANAQSSRSHAVLQIHVKNSIRHGTKDKVTKAVLSIVDLAGSERASATNNRGLRLHEGAKINQSLLALGNVINSLAKISEGATGSVHVPYRDSKLTRLLKYSLSGSCRVVMIACVSSHPQHLEETQNTLQYANRAKSIRVKTISNEEQVERSVTEYKRIIDEMSLEIKQLKEKIASLEAEKEQGKTQEPLPPLPCPNCHEQRKRHVSEMLEDASDPPSLLPSPKLGKINLVHSRVRSMEPSKSMERLELETPRLSRTSSHHYDLRSRTHSTTSTPGSPHKRRKTVETLDSPDLTSAPCPQMEDLWKQLDKAQLLQPVVYQKPVYLEKSNGPGPVRSPIKLRRRERRSMLPVWKKQ